MRLFTYPTQDAPIFQSLQLVNAGLDEILEVGKGDITSSFPPSQNLVRSLVQFDVTNISASYANGTIPLAATHVLNLRIANATGLQNGQQIEFWMVSQSWSEGTGYSVQTTWNPNDGVTWFQRDNNGNSWPSGSGGTIINQIGGISSSLQFGYPPKDVRIDVTSFVNAWVSGTFPNNGFMLKLPFADEVNTNNVCNIRFHSVQTHTVFKPTLESIWNSQTFSTGSVYTPAPANTYVYTKYAQDEYYSGSINRIDIGVRDINPIKTYDTIFTFGPRYYLPTSSYYAVIDTETNATIVPFDIGSLLSTDSSGSYLLLDTQNLYPNRYYKLLLRVDAFGSSKVYDLNTSFRVKSWL